MPAKKRRYQNNNILIATSVVFAIVVVGGFYTKRYFNKKPVTPSTTPQEIINFEPPTDQDIKEAENHKEQLSNSSGNTTSPSNGKVTPIITSWGQSNGKVEVAARVPGVLEVGGSCTLTLKRNNETRTGSSSGIANVSEVSCGFIAVERSGLTAGEWSATVTYSSSTVSGTSEAKNIVVE